ITSQSCRFLDPRALIITVGLDDKGIALPVTDIPSQPTRFPRIVRKLASIRPDRAPAMSDFKELNHPARKHHELDSVVVGKQAWPPGRVAIDWRAGAFIHVFIVQDFSLCVLAAHCFGVLLLSPFG